MKSTKLALLVMVILLGVSLSCKFLKDKISSRGSSTIDVAKIVKDLPTFDPNAPLVSPGAIAMRRLVELDPSLAEHVSGIEAVERTAMTKGRDEMRTVIQNKSGANETSNSSTHDKNIVFAEPVSQGAPTAMLMFQAGGPYSPPNTAHGASLIAGLVGGLKNLLMSDTKPSGVGSKQLSYTETQDGATTTMTMDVGYGDDGSTVFGIGGKTESTKNGVKVVTEFQGKVDGMECPNAEGQVAITVKIRLGARSGGTGYTQDLTAFVRATVDDNAQVATTTIDVIQATQHSKNGREIYVESGVTVKGDGLRFDNLTDSNLRLIQQTQNVTRSEASELSGGGHEAAFSIGLTALGIAANKWQKGGCTKIEATSPGTVAPSSTNSIRVKVRHKYDGSEVPSKLDAVLKGEKSIDPSSIAKTAGTLTYTAPGEKNKSATISLTAVSRRGRATLDLTASTGGRSYRVAGVSNGVSFTGEICSLDKPFEFEAKFPGGTAKTSFSPNSAAGGTTTVSGGGGECVHTGGGNYTVSVGEDGSGTITWTTSDTIACPGFSNSRTATFTLTLQPAPEISCP